MKLQSFVGVLPIPAAFEPTFEEKDGEIIATVHHVSAEHLDRYLAEPGLATSNDNRRMIV